MGKNATTSAKLDCRLHKEFLKGVGHAMHGIEELTFLFKGVSHTQSFTQYARWLPIYWLLDIDNLIVVY